MFAPTGPVKLHKNVLPEARTQIKLFSDLKVPFEIQNTPYCLCKFATDDHGSWFCMCALAKPWLSAKRS